MLELMNKHPKINRFMWALLILSFITVMTYFLLNGLPSVLKAWADYQQITGK